MIDSAPAVQDRHPPAADVRDLCDLLGLPRLCDFARCRRAGLCRGEGRACLERLSPLVPEPAREYVVGLFACRDEGLSYDDALARMQPLRPALEAWLDLLAAASGPRPPRRRWRNSA